MRVVFMGSSTFGLPALKLLHQKHQVVCIYTRPAKPAGRGMQEQETPIHEFALTENISVETPITLRTETAAAELLTYKPDVVVVAAYGLILPQAILDVPKRGCINIHGSLLPRWRGAAPIHHALLNGDDAIGVTIMKMDAGLDTGPMLKKGVLPGVTDSSTSCVEAVSTGIQEKELDPGSQETLMQQPATPKRERGESCQVFRKVREDKSTYSFNEIHDAIAQLGAELLIDTLDHLDTIIPEVQDESLATYAHKVTKQDAVITNDMPVQKVLSIIRTFGGEWGGRFTYKGEMLAIHSAAAVDGVSLDRGNEGASDKGSITICHPRESRDPGNASNTMDPDFRQDDNMALIKKDNKLFFPCTDGMIEIKSIQRSGKKIMPTKEFLNGFRL